MYFVQQGSPVITTDNISDGDLLIFNKPKQKRYIYMVESHEGRAGPDQTRVFYKDMDGSVKTLSLNTVRASGKIFKIKPIPYDQVLPNQVDKIPVDYDLFQMPRDYVVQLISSLNEAATVEGQGIKPNIKDKDAAITGGSLTQAYESFTRNFNVIDFKQIGKSGNDFIYLLQL
jgi:hypothetical protein